MDRKMALPDRPVSDLLTMFDNGTKKGFLTRLCYYSFVAAENDINAEYPGLNYLRNQVLSSEKVHNSIQATVCLSQNPGDVDIQQDRSTENELKSKAMEFADEMIGTVTSRVIRFCGWLYLTLLKQVCSSVQFSPAQMQSIQEVAHSNIPIIYMPLHFSHLDYILVSLILFHNKIRVPYIASGNNLHIPLFGYFIKRAGGFFIRRKLDDSQQKDLIYRAVLQTYVTELLKHGQSIEIFMEGTRSRSGLPNMPKTGMLSLLVSAVVEGQVPDALLVPVSISYEKLFEGNFNDELIGRPKMKESLWNTLKSVCKMLCGSYGSIKINFAKPISLKAALSNICMYSSNKDLAFDALVGSSASLKPTDCNYNKSEAVSPFKSSQNEMSWRRNISLLAEHVIYSGLESRSFMPTNLVAFLLINRWRSGVHLTDLVASFTRLCAELSSRRRDVGFSGQHQDAVVHALTILGHKTISLECVTECHEAPRKVDPAPSQLGGAGDASLALSDTDCRDVFDQTPIQERRCDSGIFLKQDDHCEAIISIRKNVAQMPSLLVKPILNIPEVFELAYYSNSLTPLFALESIVCLSVTAVTGFRFSTVRRTWEGNNTDLYEDSLPEKVHLSFLKSKLLDLAMELTDFLQVDLILCDVTEDLENCIKEKIDDLIAAGCLMSEAFGNSKNTHMTYGLDEEETCSDDQWLKVNLSSMSQLICYQSVLAPMVEAMAVVTEQLKVLENPAPEKQFLSRLIDVVCERSRDELATSVECCSRDILNHCIYAFKCNKVINLRDGNLSLSHEFKSPNQLKQLLSKICRYMM